MSTRIITTALIAVFSATALAPCTAQAEPWRRTISYQNKSDLFYNFYEGPDPSGVPTAMYVSPRPVPIHVGHTYTTYQPYMPHEYLHRHTRSHYAHCPGCGWSRAKIRYRTHGLWLDHWWHQAKFGVNLYPY